jgi:hypothetical protein
MDVLRASAALLALTAATAAAAPEAYVAAGFSGAYERSVLLSPDDQVMGCRVVGPLDGVRRVALERRRDAPRTRLSIVSDHALDEAAAPRDIVVGDRRYPMVSAFDGRDFRLELSAEAERAAIDAGRAALGYADRTAPLPENGLAHALRFAARCDVL